MGRAGVLRTGADSHPTLPIRGTGEQCPRPRNLRRPDRDDPPLRRRAAAAAGGEGRRGGRGSRRRSSARCGRWGCSASPSPRNMAGSASPCREEVRVALEFGRTTPAFRSVFGTNVGIGSQGLVMAGSRRAEGRMAAAASPRGEIDHQLRADRARRRLRQRLGADPGGARRRRLPALRHQALHHQCRQGVACSR